MDRKATPKPAVKHYLDLLADEGFRPTLTRDERQSILRFKWEGVAFLLIVDDEDDDFFHLALSYALGDGVDVAAAISRANDVNQGYKAVKITIHPAERSVRFHVEAFLESPATFRILERSVAALKDAARAYFEQARPADRLDA